MLVAALYANRDVLTSPVGVPLPARTMRMTNEFAGQSLLDEIDARQNELLDELDRLNQRIEQVLAECLIWRGTGESESKLPLAA